MKQSRQNITFSDLKGLEKLSKKKSNPSSLSKLLGLINKTVYQVQDDSYGMGFREWKGGIIKINGKIFPNGKGCFYGEDGKEIQKEMRTFQIGNNFYTGEWKKAKLHGQGTLIWESGDSYTGGWKNDKQHGQGTLICKSGVFYEGTFENGFAIDFSKIIITESNNKSHTITKKGQSYFYQKEGEVEIEEGEVGIENEKRLKSVLLQFGNIQSNQEGTKKMENPKKLQKLIKENKIASKDNKAKPYVIQIPGSKILGHAFAMFFENGDGCCVDNGSLASNDSLKEFLAVIEKNNVKYVKLSHEPNLKFHLKNGRLINIPIKTNTLQFCCRHGTNAFFEKLKRLCDEPKEDESVYDRLNKYSEGVSKENKSLCDKSLTEASDGNPGLLMRINSSRDLSSKGNTVNNDEATNQSGELDWVNKIMISNQNRFTRSKISL